MMPLRKSRHSKGSRRTLRGTAALEFGLAVPLLAILITAIVEIGFSMYQAMQVNYAAEAGLAYAAKNVWDSTGIASAATGSTGLSGMTATVTRFYGCSGYTGIGTCPMGQTAGQYIKISVSLTRMSIIGTTGFGLPSTFSAQSILRQN